MTNLADRERLRQQLIRHEGVRQKVYYDSTGHLTIGVGRNLETIGLTQDECMYLLSTDIDRAVRALVIYPWFAGLDPIRQAVLVNMVFNLGPAKFAAFAKMIVAVKAGQWGVASDEMIASSWATQVGQRAVELAAQMRTGLWQA